MLFTQEYRDDKVKGKGKGAFSWFDFSYCLGFVPYCTETVKISYKVILQSQLKVIESNTIEVLFVHSVIFQIW